MSIIETKYSPSVNIVRDSNYLFNYITTVNAEKSFKAIVNNVQAGLKSHIIIGAYGTGKSSFLLSFKHTLEGISNYFGGESQTPKANKYEFLSIIGEFASIEQYFANLLGLGAEYKVDDILSALSEKYAALEADKKGLVILIDEFGKFLEFAAKNNPASEIYFVQQIAEWVNDPQKDIILVTVLHQNFNAYALSLDNLLRQEWEKVKGRFREIPFNEPVEQLLFLASERLNQKYPDKKIDKNFDKLFETIKEAKVFPLKDYFVKDFAKKLYPFDILSAAILTLSLQKYGQNERSLFSFIETIDQFKLNQLDNKTSNGIHIPDLYDYLLNDYYTYLTSKYNPDYPHWFAIRRALERVYGMFDDALEQKQALSLIKLIGLLNLFANYSAKLEPRFYASYAKLTLGIKNPEETLKQLERKKIIRFVSHNLRYILFEGTDLDIELAIDDAGKLVEKVTNIVDHLNQYFEFPFISAKSIYYKRGTPRFFQFKLTEEPTSLVPEGEVDGFINLVFSEDINAENKVKFFSKHSEEAILIGNYQNTTDIKNLLFDIQKIKKVIENNQDDKIAVKLLNEEFQIKIKLLNHYVYDSLYTNNGNIIWYFKGDVVPIGNRHRFNQVLSEICQTIYSKTPVYKNELINKTKISGQIALARNKLSRKLLLELNSPNLNYSDQEFPPEKSIYLTLLKNTGIHEIIDGIGYLNNPKDTSFADLWEAGCDFLTSTKDKERTIEDFIQIISNKPYKLKQGLIDYWVPIFLLSKKDEYALYANHIYVPEIEGDILELLNKKPGQFSIKAFDIDANKLQLFNQYRVFLNQPENQNPTNKLFIQTIKPFLVFYRDLTEYSKNTNRLNKKTIALRKVIEVAKNPEKAFFDDFPSALGYTLTELQGDPGLAKKFIDDMQAAIREIRSSYDYLVDRFEAYFKDVIGSNNNFPAYRDDVKNRFSGIKAHLLLANQKPLYNRLQSDLDDRSAWLSSIAQTCIGKPLSSISDEDEMIMYDRLKDLIYEMDNLSEIGNKQIDEINENVIKIEITSLMEGLNKGILRIPKSKNKELEITQDQIRSILGKDKKLNLAILANLLQEYLK